MSCVLGISGPEDLVFEILSFILVYEHQLVFTSNALVSLQDWKFECLAFLKELLRHGEHSWIKGRISIWITVRTSCTDSASFLKVGLLYKRCHYY